MANFSYSSTKASVETSNVKEVAAAIALCGGMETLEINGEIVESDRINRLKQEAGQAGDDELVAAIDAYNHGQSEAEVKDGAEILLAVLGEIADNRRGE